MTATIRQRTSSALGPPARLIAQLDQALMRGSLSADARTIASVLPNLNL